MDEIKYPSRYKKSPRLRMYYKEGYEDAQVGRSNQYSGEVGELLARRQGQSVLDAYQKGYEAGQKAKA